MQHLQYPQRIDLNYLGELLRKPSGTPAASPSVTPDARVSTECPRKLSYDLSKLLSKPALLNLCLDAAQLATPIELAEARKRMHPARPELILTLLTYCYSAGLYASRDIEAAASTDRTLHYLCTGHRPNWRSLRRFRREHRKLLERTLAHVIHQAMLRSSEATNAQRLGTNEPEKSPSASDRQLNQSVTDRIDLAVWLDDGDAEAA